MHTVASATWTGFTGAPGTSKFKFNANLTASEASSALSKIKAVFNAIVTFIPSATTISFPTLCEYFDDEGQKTGTVQASTGQAAVAGTSASVFAAEAGAVAVYHTGRFVNGSEIIGRTFFVPMAGNAYSTSGSLGGGFQTALQNAMNTFITGFPEPVVFFDRTSKAGVRTTGAQKVTAVNVPIKSAVLRSRRD